MGLPRNEAFHCAARMGGITESALRVKELFRSSSTKVHFGTREMVPAKTFSSQRAASGDHRGWVLGGRWSCSRDSKVCVQATMGEPSLAVLGWGGSRRGARHKRRRNCIHQGARYRFQKKPDWIGVVELEAKGGDWSGDRCG